MAPFGQLRGLRTFGIVDEFGGFLVKDAPGKGDPFAPERFISAQEYMQKQQEWTRLPPAQRPITRAFRLSPISLAAYRGQAAEVANILQGDNGRSVNSTDVLQRTPLCYALDRGDAQMARLLLENGANVDIRLSNTDEGATPLTLAVDSGDVECVRLVADYYLAGTGVTSSVQDAWFDEPAARAKRLGFPEAATTLLAAGKIAVVLARGGPRPAGAPGLRQSGRAARADVDVEGNTSLHLACAARLPRTAELLAEMESDFAHANAEGDTALHAAVAARFLPVCLTCIRKGADLMAQNRAGRTPLDSTTDVKFRAELKQQAKVRDVFISYGHQPPEVARFAKRLKERLEENHITCWMDEMKPTGIEAGTEWREQIGAGINSAAAVIFVASKHSCKSEWCRRELARARDLGRPLFPVWREKTDLDDELKGYLFKTQFADFTTDALFEGGFPAFAHTVAQAVNTRGGGGGGGGFLVETRAFDLGPDWIRGPAARFQVPENGGGPHIALWCHPKDAAFARTLHAAAADRGVRCFVECPAVQPASPAEAANATRAIVKAGALLVLLSEGCAEDPHLRDRVQLAELNERPVFPVVVSNLQIPPALQYSLAKVPLHAFVGDLAFGRNVDRLLASVAEAGGALPRPASSAAGVHGYDQGPPPSGRRPSLGLTLTPPPPPPESLRPARATPPPRAAAPRAPAAPPPSLQPPRWVSSGPMPASIWNSNPPAWSSNPGAGGPRVSAAGGGGSGVAAHEQYKRFETPRQPRPELVEEPACSLM